MGTPYLSEIKIVSFGFAPRGWALCNGQLLPIAQSQALFSLLGTTYGGNGVTTFALPDLRGRVPMHIDTRFPQGIVIGEESHTLTPNELPAHVHALMASSRSGSTAEPAGATFAEHRRSTGFHPTPNAPGVPMSSVGGGQPHPNMQPFTVLNFVIALVGLFPSRD